MMYASPIPITSAVAGWGTGDDSDSVRKTPESEVKVQPGGSVCRRLRYVHNARQASFGLNLCSGNQEEVHLERDCDPVKTSSRLRRWYPAVLAVWRDVDRAVFRLPIAHLPGAISGNISDT